MIFYLLIASDLEHLLPYDARGQQHLPVVEDAEDMKARVIKLAQKQKPARVIDKIRLPLRKKNLAVCKKLMEHLTPFYTHHSASYSTHLVLQFTWLGDCCLINQGWQLQEIADEDERKRNLIEYQKEMLAFAEFLKAQYLDR